MATERGEAVERARAPPRLMDGSGVRGWQLRQGADLADMRGLTAGRALLVRAQTRVILNAADSSAHLDHRQRGEWLREYAELMAVQVQLDVVGSVVGDAHRDAACSPVQEGEQP